MNDEKIIKKKYGEKMWHLCRSLFPTILNEPGALSNLLISNFHTSRFFYEDLVKQNQIVGFKNYIYHLYSVKNDTYPNTDKTPEELLRSVGYTLYKVNNVNELLSYKKYYIPSERLCSFEEDRTKRCYVFFAIRDDAEKLKRSDFTNPERQDRYGTSVISIQFTKDFNFTLSIKNRYNHAVNNPDSTFDNNLDNIVPGLTESFAKYYGLREVYTEDRLKLSGYIRDLNGRMYKVRFSDRDYYYCEDNILIDAKNMTLCMNYSNKDRYLFMDKFILDLKNKKIISLKNDYAFINTIGDIESIEISKNEDNKVVKFINKNKKEIIVTLDGLGNIIGYKNNSIKTLPYGFLIENRSLEELSIDHCVVIEDDCLIKNKCIKKLYLPDVKCIGRNFLNDDEELRECVLPRTKYVSDNFIRSARRCFILDMPRLVMTKNGFMTFNNTLKHLYLPSIKYMGNGFMTSNKVCEDFDLPKLRKIGFGFMSDNRNAERLMDIYYHPKHTNIVEEAFNSMKRKIM